MIVKIAHYVLNTDTRELRSGEQRQLIRPKTQSLLLYLIEHEGELVSKNQLLQDIWDDVNVNEGVIFQSIREIRNLFPDLTVIQNHPRKGYQWLLPVVTEASYPTEAATIHSNDQPEPVSKRPIFWLGLLLLIATILSLNYLDSPTELSLTVLPVQHRIDRNDHEWLNEIGKESLLANLVQDLPDVRVVQAKSNPPFQSVKSGSESDWLLEVKIYGDIYDYKLTYELSNSDTTISNAILSHALEPALAQLNQELRGYLDAWPEINTEKLAQQKDFADAVKAFETDWDMALPVLQDFVSTYPENIEGHIMLLRLLLWQKHYKTASDGAQRLLHNKSLTKQQQARLHFQLARGQQPDSDTQALRSIRQGISLATGEESWLIRAELEELQGDILNTQKDRVGALRSYLKAQSLYDEINLPVNAAGLKLKLSALHLDMGQPDMAQRFFEQARNEIRSKEMSFLYAQLEEFSQRITAEINKSL